MVSILQGELADILSDAIESAGLPYAVTVTRTTTSGPDYDPVVTETPYEGQGWQDQYDQDTIDGTLVQANDVRCFILAHSLAITPTTADTLTLDGMTYAIVRVSVDPAGTALEIQGRA